MINIVTISLINMITYSIQYFTPKKQKCRYKRERTTPEDEEEASESLPAAGWAMSLGMFFRCSRMLSVSPPNPMEVKKLMLKRMLRGVSCRQLCPNQHAASHLVYARCRATLFPIGNRYIFGMLGKHNPRDVTLCFNDQLRSKRYKGPYTSMIVSPHARHAPAAYS